MPYASVEDRYLYTQLICGARFLKEQNSANTANFDWDVGAVFGDKARRERDGGNAPIGPLRQRDRRKFCEGRANHLGLFDAATARMTE